MIKVFTPDNLTLESLYDSDADYNVSWNLDATVAPLLKTFGKEVCLKIHKTHKGFIRPYSVFYIPKKVFSVKSVLSSRKVSLYDLEQYFPDNPEPQSIKEIEELTEELLEALKIMGIKPKKLTSPIKIYEEAVMKTLNLPDVYDIPVEVAEMAYKCSGKLWIEAFQLGEFKEAWDYDIEGGFPNIAKSLIDIRHLKWEQDINYRPEAIYGYVSCQVTIYDHVEVSPIIYEDEQGNMSTPTGNWDTHLTKGELDFIDKWGIGEYKIYNGWWGIPKYHTNAKPLEHVMNRLLEYKQSQNELVRRLAKRMSVGLYGKTGEEHQDNFGRFFNPVYFAEISTQCRLQVAEFIYQNKLQDNLIHVSVDGVLLDKEVEL